MANTTLTDRARPPERPPTQLGGGITRMLGHPVAYLVTAAILLMVFAWPFLSDQDRVAPTRDPAFYTWRIEALMTEEPQRLLEIEGPEGMFAAGYRVTAPILGAFLRQVADVAPLSSVTFMMVGLPVIIALLLAGFAYRSRPDPLMFHSVAFAAGGLMLTPPFVGYLDNLLVLFFIAASLWFIAPSRESWSARIAFGLLLLLCGLTHPTTLVIFCLVLGLMATIRLLVRRFDLRSVITDDGPMLLTAFAACVLTLLIWMVGLWGKSVSLAEAALLPPYGVDFFFDRLMLWVDAMRPLLNGPLLLIGLAGLLATRPWQKLGEDDLTRLSVAWLAPLVGIFGFIAGIAYTYYRFFNTTLAWVLLVGIGAYFALRFFIERAVRGGISALAWIGVAAIVFILVTNFSHGLEVSGWTNPSNQWIDPDTKKDMDALRAYLATEDPDRPVVFVADDEPPRPFQIYAFAKLTGNTSRYGLPERMIDRGYLYLGSLENYLNGEPTQPGDPTYDKWSAALLEDVEEGIELSGKEPIVVLAGVFNRAGRNAGMDLTEPLLPPRDEEIVVVSDGVARVAGPQGSAGDGATEGETGPPGFTTEEFRVEPVPAPGLLHLLLVAGGLFVLMIPGWIAFKVLLPEADMAEAVGLVPALAAAFLSISAVVVLAVVRGPFSLTIALVSLVVAAVAASLMGMGGSGRMSFTAGGRRAST